MSCADPGSEPLARRRPRPPGSTSPSRASACSTHRSRAARARARATTGTSCSTVSARPSRSTPAARTRSAAASCSSTAPTPAWASRPWRRPRFYDLDDRRRRLLREDRPAALRQRPRHHRRADLRPLRRGRALPLLRDRGVARRRARRSRSRRRRRSPRSRKAAHELDGITQMVMTTGTSNGRDRGATHLARCVRAVREVLPDLPIQVQCEPPGDLRPIPDLYDAGARSIGIHVESLDDDGRLRWMPGKGVGADGRVPRRLGRGRPRLRLEPGLDLPPRRPRRGPRRAGRRVRGAHRDGRLPLRRAVPAAGRHPGHRRRPARRAPPARRSTTSPAGSPRPCAAAGMLGADQAAGCAACGACSALAACSDEARVDDRCLRRRRGHPHRRAPHGARRSTRSSSSGPRRRRARGLPPRCGARSSSTSRGCSPGPTATTSTTTRAPSSSSPAAADGEVLGGVRLAPGRSTGPRPRLVARQPARRRPRRPDAARASAPPSSAPPAPTAEAAGRAALRRDRAGARTRRSSAGSAGCRASGPRPARPPARRSSTGRSPGSSGWPTPPRPPSAACSATSSTARRRRAGFVGDDGAPVPGSDLVAACDAILPSMVERDPEWAGWCAVLVNLNDLSAMGATPVGLLDAVGARDAVLRPPGPARARRRRPRLGRARCSAATPSSACPAALSVTALGRTDAPGPRRRRPRPASRSGSPPTSAAAGGPATPAPSGTPPRTAPRPSCARWRGVVPALAPDRGQGRQHERPRRHHRHARRGQRLPGRARRRRRPGARRRRRTATGSPASPASRWSPPRRAPPDAPAAALPGFVTTAVCGELTAGAGVGLRWPDGVVTEAVTATVTGMGAASMTTTLTAPPSGRRRRANFGRDVEREPRARSRRYVDEARARGVRLLALPEACLGGYLSVLGTRPRRHATTRRPTPCRR